MHRNAAQFRRRGLAAVLGLGLALGAAWAAAAAGGYAIGWLDVSGGGGASSGGGYSLVGTLGQPEAGVLDRGGYHLAGGFWHAAGAPAVVEYEIFVPVVRR